MYIYILKCGPGLLFLGLNWPSVQVEFDMPDLDQQKNGVFWDVTPCGSCKTSQKTEFFIVTTMKTSNLTINSMLIFLVLKI
jgi:hypothetical protein